MKNIKIYTLFIVACLVLVVSCKPKNDPGKKDFIKKNWKVTKATQKQTGVDDKIIYTEGGTANTEDFSTWRLSFSTDKDYSYTFQTITNSTGTYAFNGTETTIAFTGGALSGAIFSIDALTQSTFNFNYSQERTSKPTRTLVIETVPVQ
ncbi:MAG: hypothetical protein H7Y04_14250 [Verrucomicrobia bacterium]|nr:hypothetical protein [Cytophagales bacterium]